MTYARLPHYVMPLIATLFLLGCEQEQQQPPMPQTPPAVTVIEVGASEVTPTARYSGRVEAVDRVDLQARLSGYVVERPFTEGRRVKAGDLLFTIDKEPLKALVSKAEGNLARAEANLRQAKNDRGRVLQLRKTKAIAQREVDKAAVSVDKAAANVKIAEASLNEARLHLGYTEVRAPFDGVVGIARAAVGDLVGPGFGKLVTVTKRDPIYVSFPVPMTHISLFRQEQQRPAENVPVTVFLARDTAYAEQGTLVLLDSVANSSTDTILARAEFPNPHGVLVDSQLVGVTVQTGQTESRITIPLRAAQFDQGGRFVLVVDGDSEVSVRRIATGITVGERIVVKEGLVAGERIIVEGMQRVRPGMIVNAQLAGPEQ